ncbi:MAG: glycoside hydrolase family 127 protein [Verrucomicrobia bacterium]|nr:glycoside hydrolase family 127 protein [Verrucomicrobiota bacterium]
MKNETTNEMEPIDVREIEVRGLIGSRLDLTWRNNLLALDWENDFLAPFREKKGNGGEYVGLGKTVDGLVRFAAHTSEPKLLELRKQVLVALIGAQETDGYLGAYQVEQRITKLWDVHEQSHLLFALVSDWQYFHDKQSLNAAQKLGNHLVAVLSAMPLAAIGNEVCLELATLGLDRALLALYRVTKNSRYLDFCLNVLKLVEWNLPIVEGRHGKIEGHAYVYFTKCLAQLDLYELTGDPRLMAQTHGALEYLRRKGGLVITGSCGQTECWHSDQNGTGDLGETCATAYLIRLLHRLMQLEGKSVYGDWMERTIYNALFAAQSPDGRRLRYYAPFEGKRVYWNKDTYCCPGNFRRIMSELPEMIFYKQAGGLVVNLYTACTLKTEIATDLRLEVCQDTDYPNSGKVRVRINPSKAARFPVRLRIPSWCRTRRVKVNDRSVSAPFRNGFVTLVRQWKTGDTIALEMDMPWRFIRGFGKQQGRAAVMRGPILFCLNPGRNQALAGHDLKAITLDPATLQPPAADHALRPNGQVCRLKAFIQPSTFSDVVLTEFPDPGGEATYFQVSNPAAAVEDGLLDDRLINV